MFIESVADPTEMPKSVNDSLFECRLCPHSQVSWFSNSRALQMHQRRVHGVRSILRLFAGADNTCQACSTTFSTRLRLMAHMADSRRVRCREWLFAHGVRISTEQCAQLDAVDLDQRRQANRAGHTQPLSIGPAVSRTGRTMGIVSCQ